MDQWKDLFIYNPSDYIEDFGVFKDFITIGKKVEGMDHLLISL